MTDPWQHAAIKPPTRENVRSHVLAEADELVNGDRNIQYGDPNQDFSRTASLWNSYIGESSALQAHDVAIMLTLLKISRLRWNPTKRDSWVDGAGYMACGYDCADQLVLFP